MTQLNQLASEHGRELVDPSAITVAHAETGFAAPASAWASAGDLHMVEALRRGDEAAFGLLLDRYQRSMLRVARIYVRRTTVAEEVVQETWISVLQSLDRFEGRCSLKTWIFRILTNRAKTWGAREGRHMPFSELERTSDEFAEPAVDPARFDPSNQHWAAAPRSWDAAPEERFLARETCACVRRTVATLPPSQRRVITLRDIEGWGAEEVCQLLDITEANQRVLLHRARSKVRQALERYFAEA